MMAKKTESPKSYIKSAKKKNSVLENLLSYFLTIALSFLFALFCSWRVGIFLLLLLLLSPLLSFLLILLMRPMIAVEMQLSKPVAAKKERLRISMSLSSRFPFPTPGIVIEILKNPCVIYESLAYEVAIMPFSSVSVSIPVTTKICGAVMVGVERIYLTDYLGIFKLRISSGISQKLAIIPDVADISGDEDYIRQTYVLSTTTGDSDETVEAVTNVMGGFPGYEHREYAPGDPLKRVNWKLSAKRDKLYVRLDDEMASSSVMLVLDPVEHNTEKELAWLPKNLYPDSAPSELPALVRQNAVETSLGVAMALLSHNLKVVYCYKRTEGWESVSVEHPGQISLLQQELASFAFCRECEERFPFTAIPEKGAAFICTTCRHTEIPFQNIIVYSAFDGKGRML